MALKSIFLLIGTCILYILHQGKVLTLMFYSSVDLEGGDLKPPPPQPQPPGKFNIINKPLTITLSIYNPSEIFLDTCMWNLFGLNKRLRIFTCVGAHAGISKSKRFNIFFLHDRTTFIVTWFKIWGKIIFACYV